MDTELLATKLFSPKPGPNLVNRPRLASRLSTAAKFPLTLVCAPAGYGKTSLVSSWLLGNEYPFAWLSLDESDNDPIRFLQYFLAALHQAVPSIQPDLLSLLQGMPAGAFEPFLNILINAIADQNTQFFLVLDDFQVLNAQPVMEMCAYLLEHSPSGMHLLLLTRSDPPLPLPRLRARGQLLEVRAGDLRFTQEETALFLDQALGFDLSEQDALALEQRTEGWIAGLQLAAASMKAAQDAHQFVSAFTGSHHYIIDYLTDEVLSRQPEEVQSFLLQTSILERMCGPLCDAVVRTTSPGASGGQAILHSLERANLFLVPLDEQRRWYRYHSLFADVLNRYLEQRLPGQIPALHARASLWFEQNGLIFEAVHHALSAGDRGLAARLVDQHGCDLLMRGEVVNLLRWIEAVEPAAQTFPWVAIQKAWALTLTGQPDRVEQILQTAEGLIAAREPSEQSRILSGAVAGARAYLANVQGDTVRASEFARLALNSLPASNDFSCSLRSVATSILGDASWIDGNLEEARSAYSDAVEIGKGARNLPMMVIASIDLAGVLREQGRLRLSARIYQETLEKATFQDGSILPFADQALAGLARIYYEWNELETGRQYLSACIRLGERRGNYGLLVLSNGLLAQLELASGNSLESGEAARTAGQLAGMYALSPSLSMQIKTILARLSLCQGDLERVALLVRESGISPEEEIAYPRAPEYLLLLSLFLAQADYDPALRLAGRLLQKARVNGWTGLLGQALVLQAIAFHGRKENDKALSSLEKALLLAQPEGLVRTFLDEGEAMARLLFQAKAHGVCLEYVAQLLAAVDRPSRVNVPAAQSLVEPLTSRELEVLQLIDTGCSNQEIASRLFISLPTVKRHISNIYAKLGAGSRTQAVALARDLRLFE